MHLPLASGVRLVGAEREKKWESSRPIQSIAAAIPPIVLGIGIASLAGLLFMAHTPGRSLHLADLDATSRAFIILGLALEAVLVAALIGVGILKAVRRRWVWAFSWIGSGLVQFYLLLVLLGEDRMHLITPWVDGLILAAMLILGAGAMLMAAVQGWQAAGLLGLALSSTLGLSMFFWVIASPFNRYDLAWIAAPVGIIFGWLVWMYVRGQVARQVSILFVAGLINAASIGMAELTWRASGWFQETSNTFWIAEGLSLGLLASGPLLALILAWVAGIRRRDASCA